MGRRRIFLLLLSAALALSLAGCGQAEPPSASGTDFSSAAKEEQAIPASIPFTLAFYPEYTLHPARAANRANLTLGSLLYEGLFSVDASFQAQPLLCSGYTVSEDGLTWTFTLREGITFSDGTPLTGTVAAQALRDAMAPDSHYAQRLGGVRSVAAGEGTVTVTLSIPNGALPVLLDIPIALGDGDRPLGTGPYVLTEEATGETVLTARSGWWQGRSLPFQTIHLASVGQADDLISSFDAGDITLLDADLTGTNSLGYSGSYEAWDYSTTNLIYLGFNTQRGPFRSAQLRRALSRGIDRRSIAEISFAHHAVPTALPIHPDSPLYHQLLSDSADYSPDDLVKGLEGQQLGSDGLVFLVNSENSSKVAAAQRIVDQLSGAGVSISLERLSWTDYLAALERGDFDLYLAEVRLTADFDLTQLVGTRGGLNYGGWSDPSTDGLLSAFRAAGAELRSSAAASLCSHLIQNAPIVPICFKNGSVLTQWGRLSGLDPVRDNVFHGLENWVLDP